MIELHEASRSNPHGDSDGNEGDYDEMIRRGSSSVANRHIFTDEVRVARIETFVLRVFGGVATFSR